MNKKEIKLEEEGGITQISLANIEKLERAHGPVRAIEHDTFSKEQGTSVIFSDGHEYRATGFSCGYRGEGPHGLLSVIQNILARSDITIHHIAGWDWRKRKKYLIFRGSGSGVPIRTYNAGDLFTLEVW